MATDGLRKDDDDTWMEVALTFGDLEAQVIAGLLRTAEIPSYIEQSGGLSSSAFGQMGVPSRVYVPAKFYESALDLLDDNEDLFPPSLDEPSIKF